MKKSFCSAVLMLIFCLAYGQQENQMPTKSVFVELGGAGLAYSFNYETRFDKSRIDSWGIRIGAGGYSLEDESLLTVPLQFTKILGKGNHYFEFGGGATFVNYKRIDEYYYIGEGGNQISNRTEHKDWHFILDVGETPSFMGTLNLGYRKIPDDRGFTWRVNLTPVFNGNGFWPLFGGIGLGYAF